MLQLFYYSVFFHWGIKELVSFFLHVKAIQVLHATSFGNATGYDDIGTRKDMPRLILTGHECQVIIARFIYSTEA